MGWFELLDGVEDTEVDGCADYCEGLCGVSDLHDLFGRADGWVGRAYLERCKPPDVAAGRHCGCRCCGADELWSVVLQRVLLLQKERERERERDYRTETERQCLINNDDGTTTSCLHVKQQCSCTLELHRLRCPVETAATNNIIVNGRALVWSS